MIAREHDHRRYEGVPARIEAVTGSTRLAIQATVDTARREAVGIPNRELAQAVAGTAAKIARAMATRQTWQWMIGGITGAAVAVRAAAGTGYRVGKAVAPSEATARARQAVEAVSWAKTPVS